MSARPFCLPAGVVSGVYHLLDAAGALLYVGQTDNFYRRLAFHPLRHIAAEVRFFPAAVDDLDALEASHIREFAPRYNRAGLTTYYISVLGRRHRGITFRNEQFANADEFLEDRRYVGVGELRALRLLSKSAEVPELIAAGFPEPAFVSRWPYWKARDVLTFLQQQAAP
jgi:hypothetical protein